MELLFLGTGAGIPAKTRNVTSIALKLLEERRSVWLFDCGEATQHQILHTSIKPGKIEKIFITHLHGDHVYGLPGLVSSRSFQGGESCLTVYGPKGIKAFLETALEATGTHLTYPLVIEEIEEGTVFEDDQFIVTAKRVVHGIPAFGYRVEEKDVQGALDAEALKEIGISPGPVYQKLKNGETVTLEDGRTVNGADFIGPPKKGRIIAISGDTRKCENVKVLAEHADVLVHEATFAGGDRELAGDYYHSTTEQAAETAREAGAEKLILTHISARYQGESVNELINEAKEIFPNSTAAYDFYEYEVKRR
ncbi:ribonuclease Z [Bacillus glycinifermentans]|uniref:Ribonuclease Z n=1 Tax=Bacillus glycinifermentans TaxID=1664069 RepID=A0A0J6EYB2_9BACI|nr:ribonuclease Z [Bacillus glycinifermentans]ATH92296.1 ribonuclease [Bacillus glycinifermentans]KMM52372.1 ribonuclease Z [Bacillus glycinifermentans]KRT95042.1 ribonuclease Z [Bacillus glycinifermentans]MEC0484816.1 ribonuclease Z [Bacillus glycinifermentans]MEC0495934.1 ribonuclease Z [Bacillus glycinifermentans]